MKNYSIVRIGNEYVVQADEKSVIKVASRRRAARLVTDADDLLKSQPAPPDTPEAHTEPSISFDPTSTLILPKFLDDSGRFPYAPRRDTSPQREACYLEG